MTSELTVRIQSPGAVWHASGSAGGRPGAKRSPECAYGVQEGVGLRRVQGFRMEPPGGARWPELEPMQVRDGPDSSGLSLRCAGGDRGRFVLAGHLYGLNTGSIPCLTRGPVHLKQAPGVTDVGCSLLAYTKWNLIPIFCRAYSHTAENDGSPNHRIAQFFTA